MGVNLRIFTGFKLISSCVFFLFIDFLEIGISLSRFILAIQKIVKAYFSAIYLSIRGSSSMVPDILQDPPVLMHLVRFTVIFFLNIFEPLGIAVLLIIIRNFLIVIEYLRKRIPSS